MVPWWVVVVSLFVGCFFGIGIVALCAAGESNAERMWKDSR